MPQDTKHPEYLEMAPVWARISIALAGRRAVLAAKKECLMEVTDQTPMEYEAYQRRAIWVGYTSKTAAGWVGIATRKPATIAAPGAKLEAFVNNCDKRGMPFSSYVQVVLRNLVEKSRCGTLVDWDTTGNPYLTHYGPEQIINWEVQTINGTPRLSFVMLYELSSKWLAADGQPAPDDYERPTYEQYREFRLDTSNPAALKVNMTLWRRKVTAASKAKATSGPGSRRRGDSFKQATDKTTDFIAVENATLTRRGDFAEFIPFIFHTATTRAPECIAKPMLEDIADINFAHFGMSADLQNGRHMAGLPTPWAVKFTDPDKPQKLALGTGAAWVSDAPEAKCGFLEMTGSALKCLQDGMTEAEKAMAALGAQAIEPPTKNAEAVGTVELRQRAETASLVTVAEMASRSLSVVLQWADWVTGTAKTPTDNAKTVYVVIPCDMTGGRMQSQDLTALVAAYQSGSISFETFFSVMQKGEMYPDARTMDEEKADIEKGGPQQPLPPPDPAAAPGGF